MAEETFTYPAVVAKCYEGGRLWVASFPGLNGCWAEGASKEEVVRQAPVTLAAYIKSCREADYPISETMTAENIAEADIGEVMEFTVTVKY